MKNAVEIYQIAYRVNSEWKLSEFKMTCEKADEVYAVSEWRIVPNSGEVCQPGDPLCVPVDVRERGKLKRWTRAELIDFYRGPIEPLQHEGPGDPVDAGDYRVVRDDEDYQWWVDRPQAPRPKVRTAGLR